MCNTHQPFFITLYKMKLARRGAGLAEKICCFPPRPLPLYVPISISYG